MIKSFRHKGIEEFYRSGSKAGIQQKHVVRLSAQLTALDAASKPADMNFPNWHLHSLAGDLAGHWAVKVDKNWRLTFAFENGDAVLTDYQDYH